MFSGKKMMLPVGITLLMFFSGNAFTSENECFSSIVKVFSVQSKPDFHQPWQNSPQTSTTGSGCVISGGKILTNAHVVANATFVMVRKHGNPKKYVAKTIVAGHDCDLAVLKVDDPEFFKDVRVLDIGELPNLQDTVTVLGYPVGGDNISITEGVVSRIEPTLYSHSGRVLLSVQIDAAINLGNSGGPVVQKGKIVGIAFQSRGGENLGYMIPSPVIKHFLKDIEDGKFDGFPDIDGIINTMENPDMRKWAQMNENQTGIVISHLACPEEKKGVFRVNDVILEIDGISVSNDGTIPFRRNEVVFFGYLIWEKFIGDNCHFKILRDKKIMEFDYKVETVTKLVPRRMFDVLPSYYIIGGFVFVPLTQNYLDGWSDWRKAPEIANLALRGEITEERDQVVILSNVLADDVNIGYQNVGHDIVKSINGKPVKNLMDLISTIESGNTGFFEILLEDYNKIIMDVEKAKKATPAILRRCRIDSDRSKDFKK